MENHIQTFNLAEQSVTMLTASLMGIHHFENNYKIEHKRITNSHNWKFPADFVAYGWMIYEVLRKLHYTIDILITFALDAADTLYLEGSDTFVNLICSTDVQLKSQSCQIDNPIEFILNIEYFRNSVIIRKINA